MNENKVTLISGGGSGHEPAHAGLVGRNVRCGSVRRCVCVTFTNSGIPSD